MIPKFVLPALLAICSIVSALPATPTANTVELFKRDDPVTERDFELADLHGVNLAESYKHAVIRRDNGDDLTIWVHLSFVEERDDSVAGNLVERQARPIETTGVRVGGVYRAPPRCIQHTYVSKTTSTSPFADSTASLFTWAENTNGSFSNLLLYNVNPQPWIPAVVAGTNSGGNVQFSFRSDYSVMFMTSDIIPLIPHVLTHFQAKYGNTWRVEAEGTMSCWTAMLGFTMTALRYKTSWKLTGTQVLV